jgi:N-acetylneuraminic acid mutarotase
LSKLVDSNYLMRYKLIYAGIFLTALGLTGCSKNNNTTTTLGNWIQRSDFNGNARMNAVAFVIGNEAYLGTGFDGQERLNDFWEYDPSLNAWIQKANFPGTPRSNAVGFAVDGKGYITTGYDGVNYLGDTWQYNPTSNSWTQVANFGGTPRYGATGFAVGDTGYVTCGYDGNYKKDFWAYIPSSNQWTLEISMGGNKRINATSFVINNIAYLFGGTDNNAEVNDFWAYNPATGLWTQKRDINNANDSSYDADYTSIERDEAAAFVIGDTAYVATGENPSLITNVWQYDPNTDLWTSRTAFPGTPRIGAVGFSVNNRGFIATGGNGQTTPYDDLWEFQPYVQSGTNTP